MLSQMRAQLRVIELAVAQIMEYEVGLLKSEMGRFKKFTLIVMWRIVCREEIEVCAVPVVEEFRMRFAIKLKPRISVSTDQL